MRFKFSVIVDGAVAKVFEVSAVSEESAKEAIRKLCKGRKVTKFVRQ